jgi:thioredoxin reductase (NADPH)
VTIESVAPGGQAGTSSRIENYLGFPAGVSGLDLTNRALTQARKFGATFTTPCEAVRLRNEADHLVVELNDESTLAARAVLVATGACYRRLDVARLAKFEGAGVYYAATDTEVRMCRGEPVLVVGGGNSAGQAALHLARAGCRVNLAVRAENLDASMSSYLSTRLEVHPNITLHPRTIVTALHGDGALSAVTLKCSQGGSLDVPVAGLFSFIGADPATTWLTSDVNCDSRGFIRTDRDIEPSDLGSEWATLGRQPLPYESSRIGLFAVGDVRSGSIKRVASAVGEGSAAVRSIHDHLAFGRQTA